MADSVQAANLTPDKPVLHVGEELRCSASGNPTPQLTFSPPVEATQGGRFGVAWITMVVPAKWKGQRQTINCTAVNELDGQEHTATASATFDVEGQYATLSRSTSNIPRLPAAQHAKAQLHEIIKLNS